VRFEFEICTSVRYDSWPTTYESVWVIVSPLTPRPATVTILYGSRLVPVPVGPTWLIGVNAVLGLAPPPAGMLRGP